MEKKTYGFAVLVVRVGGGVQDACMGSCVYGTRWGTSGYITFSSLSGPRAGVDMSIT